MKCIQVEIREDASLHPFTIALEGKNIPTAFYTKLASSSHVREFKFGGITSPVKRVIYRRQMRDSLHIPKLAMNTETLRVLKVPVGHTLHLGLQQDALLLGPILGLYVDIQDNFTRRFGEQTQLFRDLSTIGEQIGVCVTVIGPSFHSTNMGWRLLPMGNQLEDGARSDWQPVALKKPDLVLRRSGSFAKKESAAIEDLRKFAKANLLHTLPRICSNKWHLYEFLKKIPEIRSYLPFTTVANEAKQVYEAVRTRKDVYIKPLSGSQGISIYHLRGDDKTLLASWEERIVPRQTERLSTVFQPDTQIRSLKVSSMAAFYQFWQATGLKRCLVQDKVSLCRMNDRPVDFRWLVQSSDQPRVVARVARVGKEGAVTTNIHTGGQAMAFEDVIEQLSLENMTNKQNRNLVKELDDLAISVMRCLVEKYGPFVEMGIDVAIDEKGKIYLFEVNPTPGRRMLKSLDASVRELSLREMLEYAIRATGFSG